MTQASPRPQHTARRQHPAPLQQMRPDDPARPRDGDRRPDRSRPRRRTHRDPRGRAAFWARLCPVWRSRLGNAALLSPPKACCNRQRQRVMGKNPAYLSSHLWTVAGMIDAQERVIWSCRACNAWGLADLLEIQRQKGPTYSLVDRTAPCRIVGCGGRVGFHYGSPARPLKALRERQDSFVRRQKFWDSRAADLVEGWPRLGLRFRRRFCGAASADVRGSGA